MVEIHEINNRYTWRFGTFNQTATLHKTKMVLQILHYVFYDLSQAVSYSLQVFLCSCKYHLHLRFALQEKNAYQQQTQKSSVSMHAKYSNLRRRIKYGIGT